MDIKTKERIAIVVQTFWMIVSISYWLDGETTKMFLCFVLANQIRIEVNQEASK